jgi:poly(ADP-ribose) glycohydrolase ARH3
MRVSPIGLFFASDIAMVTAQAELSAAPTHAHEIGIDGARVLAAAAMYAAASFGEIFDRNAFLQKLLLVARTEEFRWQLEHALQLKQFDSLAAFGNSLEAHRSVMTSILCFADSPDSYEEAVSRAIGQGDDVDTLAAMAGTLSGARLGISEIPANLIACLEDNEQGRTFLFDLAEQLWVTHCRSLEARERRPVE